MQHSFTESKTIFERTTEGVIYFNAVVPNIRSGSFQFTALVHSQGSRSFTIIAIVQKGVVEISK